jgi:hypothetical protein
MRCASPAPATVDVLLCGLQEFNKLSSITNVPNDVPTDVPDDLGNNAVTSGLSQRIFWWTGKTG